METPTIIILVGVTGDLAKRKLLPAIEALKGQGRLPNHFKLVGVSRQQNEQGYFQMDLEKPEDYARLSTYLEDIESEWGRPAQRLFYLSVAPKVSLPIIEQLGKSGLASVPNTKLLMEKPFGLNSTNAKEIIDHINDHFSPEQQYRVDHYLSKAPVRALAQHPINPAGVTGIRVIAHESIGIEGRANFYEQTGALRDIIQSHLLQVAALALHPSDRLAMLKEFSLPSDKPITESVRRGQYEGYKEAAGNAASMVETFVSIDLVSRGPLFSGTVTLETGKALPQKTTELIITHRDGSQETISLNDAGNAYEQVFIDAINSDKTFFVTNDEVLETWRILDPILDTWQQDHSDHIIYPHGSFPA